MAEIICDTTVWYHDRCKDYKGMLTATFLNIGELSHSDNMHLKIGLWKNAIRRVIEEPAYYHYTDPYEYLVHSGFDPVIDNKSYLENARNALLQFDEIIEMKDIQFKPEVVTWLEEKNKFVVAIKNDMQQLVINSRAKYKAAKASDEGVELVEPDEMKLLFRKNYCQPMLDKYGFNVDVKDIDWTEFELFQTAGIQFFHELNIGQGEWDVNDYDDLWNLVYVSPRDQYYVIEKKWRKLIERSKMEKYIFPASYLPH